jgi:hypothetical protein
MDFCQGRKKARRKEPGKSTGDHSQSNGFDQLTQYARTTMQHLYVGDIGDYLKLSILKAIEPNHRLGIAWWRYPDQEGKKDGRHIGYLSNGKIWREYDPEIFDHLASVVLRQRNLAGLESAPFLAGSLFASQLIPVATRDRQDWVCRIAEDFEDRNVVFFDPDNGLEPPKFAYGKSKSGKSITVDELKHFRRTGRTLIVYHHHTHRKGGHIAEIDDWASRLAEDFTTVDAIRCKPWSPRVYFLLDASDTVRLRCQLLCERWGGHMQWNPHAESRQQEKF